MEHKNDIGMKHVAHEHLLILNEIYVAKEGDVCCGCREQIYSCKSFVYSCSNITSTTSTSDVDSWCPKFLLHKTCAELPLTLIIDPSHPEEFLFFEPSIESRFKQCIICGLHLTLNWLAYCDSTYPFKCVCLKCAVFQVQQMPKEDSIIVHPGHSHPLALIQQPSSFQCDVCKVSDNILDSSYRCTKCQFWMHKTCGDAPDRFQFQFHKHRLSLLFCLPKDYRRFDQFCRICNEMLNQIEWIYCCRSCRYFTHFKCARSSPMLSSSDDEADPNLVHLPAADELSLNQLLTQLIKDKITLSDSYNNSSISSTTNNIKHWSHEEHDLKLITINELYDRKNDDDILLLCDGCVKPIRTCDSLFYGCVPCKYFMHKVCAELPREVEYQLGGPLFANKYSEPLELFECSGCRFDCNGIFFSKRISVTPVDFVLRLCIRCVTLPKVVKHEAHHHQLQFCREARLNACNACGYFYDLMYRCKKCKFYVCRRCIMQAKTYKHRWDPHPLDLIHDAGMVEEHEHEFDCEYCSKEIDTNRWFYHCSKCDLSLHTFCTLRSSYRLYKFVKFGATDIIKDQLHPHRLTFVLNEKVRHCMNCGEKSRGQPVLQCAPCNRIIFCNTWERWCWLYKRRL